MNEETEVPEVPEMTEVLLVTGDCAGDEQSSKCKIKAVEVADDSSDCCSGSGDTASTTLPITRDNIDDKDEMKYRQWMTMELMTIYCVLIASFGSFCIGLFIGWSSHVNGKQSQEFSTMYASSVASYLALGAAIGAFVTYRIWHRIGTKKCIIFSCLVMSISTIALFIEHCVWVLMAGRIAAGYAIGSIHFLIPVYIHDIAHIHNIQTYNCIMQVNFAAGVLTMYITGLFESTHLACILCVIASIVFTIGFCLLPESPRFLAAIGNENVARYVITKFKMIDDKTEKSIDLWKRHNKFRELGYSVMFNGTLSARLILTLFGLVLFEQLLGAIGILFYMEKILALTHGKYSPITTSILCVIVFTVSIAVPKLTGYRFKSKSTLVWTCASMGIVMSLFGIHCHFLGTFNSFDEYHRELPFYLLGLFYFFYAIGPFRLTWHFVKRMLPAEYYLMVRSVLATVSWLATYGITRIMPWLLDFIGVGWVFWYISVTCIIATVFISKYIPEKFTIAGGPDQRKLVGSVSSSETTSELGDS